LGEPLLVPGIGSPIPPNVNSCSWQGCHQHRLLLPGTLIRCRWGYTSPRLWTPPNRHLPPSNPLTAPIGQMLALGNESLMNGAGQHRDAVPAHLVAKVLIRRHDRQGVNRMVRSDDSCSVLELLSAVAIGQEFSTTPQPPPTVVVILAGSRIRPVTNGILVSCEITQQSSEYIEVTCAD
jgi:hypothetical protein